MNRALVCFTVALSLVAALGCQSTPAPSSTPTSAASAAQLPSPSLTMPSPGQSVVANTDQARAPQLPAELTGRIECGRTTRVAQESSFEIDGTSLSRFRNGAWRQVVTMSDERFKGTTYHTYESDTYATAGGGTGPEIWSATYRIENESGAWESKSIGGSFSDGSTIGADGPAVWIGEGAYAGLVAVMASTPVEECATEVRGLIFEVGPLSEPYNSSR